jgi:hypothetical protein
MEEIRKKAFECRRTRKKVSVRGRLMTASISAVPAYCVREAQRSHVAELVLVHENLEPLVCCLSVYFEASKPCHCDTSVAVYVCFGTVTVCVMTQ